MKHHAALPYDEIGEFFELLRKEEGTAVRGLVGLMRLVPRVVRSGGPSQRITELIDLLTPASKIIKIVSL